MSTPLIRRQGLQVSVLKPGGYPTKTHFTALFVSLQPFSLKHSCVRGDHELQAIRAPAVWGARRCEIRRRQCHTVLSRVPARMCQKPTGGATCSSSSYRCLVWVCCLTIGSSGGADSMRTLEHGLNCACESNVYSEVKEETEATNARKLAG